MHIGLFFGSFNPVHYGHLMIASYMLNYHDFKEVWFVVTPSNPFKTKEPAIDEQLRLEMLELALDGAPGFKVLDIEFGLPRPSYTINTLKILHSVYPQHQFGIIMGHDNLLTFSRWKDYELILSEHRIYVYPRLNAEKTEGPCFEKNHSIIITQAPVINISSSLIRASVAAGKTLSFFTPQAVLKFIAQYGLYRP